MKNFVSGLLVFAVFWSMFMPFATDANGQIAGRTINRKIVDLPSGFKFRLSEGVEGAETRVRQLPAATDPLSETAAADLLKRLPAIKIDQEDQTDFANRSGTLPAPKTGKQIPIKFPSDSERGTPKIDPGTKLEVVRYSPEGEVPLAPDLNVTFSQPMVAVTSQEQAAQYAPVELSPQVEGRWRWLGTKTLMFDTTKRFPMATRFTARVPAGTKAANGQTLAKDVTWTFTTPPPKVEQMFPQNQVVRRDALMFVSFDQAINPEAVIKTISVTGRNQKIPVRLATQAEIDADGSISYYAKQAQPGRWMVFRAVNSVGGIENALPPASPITVNIQKGTPSAEGPLATVANQIFQFTTYGPFKLNRAMCGWSQNPNCSPFETWMLEFNNPIEAASFTKEMLRIEPAVESLRIYPSGNYVYVQGYKKGRTTYTITIDGSLKDNFGQTLGQPTTATIKVGAAPQSLFAEGGPMAVLDPAAKPTFSIYSTNHSTVRVRLYSVKPEDWDQFQEYYRRINYDDDTKRPAIPGRLVSDKTVNIENKPDEMVETRVDVVPGLNGGFGNVIVAVEPTVKRDRYDRSRVFTWLQATQIGLDAFVDNSELVGFATDLRTGAPLPGVELSIYPNGSGDGGLALNGEQPATNNEQSWWDWLTSWGSSQAEELETTGADGSTIESVEVMPAQTNRTPASGVLRLPLPGSQSTDKQNLLIARRGNDMAFLPENSDYYWQQNGNWYKKPDVDSLRWFVFDDRRMYKPKEEVSVKGYIRKMTGRKLGDIESVGGMAREVSWSVKDPRNNEIAKGGLSLNAFGAFDFRFKLPDNANLGHSRIDFFTGSPTGIPDFTHQFQIQEFRRPEFEVSAKIETEAPHIVGQSANVSVEAKYYAGGGLANAETNWTVTATPTNYTPPNRDDFIFGTWIPWWRIYDYGHGGYGIPYGGTTQTFKGVTDAGGRHLLKIDFESVKPPRPYSLTVNGAVQDVNRQTWAGNASLLVHPASLYVGIRTPRTFVQKGEKITVESIVTDIDGKFVLGRNVEIKAVLKDWVFDKGSWKEETVDEQACTVKSGEAPQKCEFVAKRGGRYTITATVMDDRERLNESEFTVWVPGGKQPPKRNVEQEEVQIIPSKKDYAPGETAELLVISPFTPAEGILTLRREGIVKTERFSMKESSMTLKIPLEEKYLPNIYAQVDLVGAAVRTDDKGETAKDLTKRPAYASGNINLPISTASRKLTVSAAPKDKTLIPGGETKVAVEVNDSSGEPVANSEVAVVIVDESVLALSGYSVADPMSIFYTARGTGTQDYHSRKDVLLGNPEDVKPQPSPPPAAGAADMVSAEGLAGARQTLPMMARRAVKSELKETAMVANDASQQQQIALRENFNALAVFAPSVKTDSNGRAVIDVKLPDNLTRYRITAISVDQGKRFGKGESSITAKQPLMVRPSAPRFMNFGDRIELPVVVQNQTDKDLSVDVAIRATNAVLSTGFGQPSSNTASAKDADTPPGQAGESNMPPEGGTQNAGKRVAVKANDRAEVRFPVAAVKAGTARFQIAVNSGTYADAAEISLPVWTPATTEAFATYGTTDQNGAILQPVQTPGDIYPQFGGLEVTTSSTQLQELTDAFIYLYRYPFECSEQVASRMLSIAALRDVLTAFKAKEMPSEGEITASFAKDVKILQSRQRDDGSYGLWRRDRERYEYPFLTVHVTHALTMAKAKGYQVPDEMLKKSRPYLKEVEKHFDEWHRMSPQARWTVSAYALYVRDLMGDKDAAKAKRLLAEATIEKLPFEALGWVLSVLANDVGSTVEIPSITRFLLNRTTETAAHANFITNYGDGAWLVMYSNRRADGVLLEAMLKANGAGGRNGSDASGTLALQSGDLIPKLVRGLLDHRKKGHWGSTQENVFILLALDKYFEAYEKVTPDFVTRVWLGNTYAGEEAFKGRSVDSNLLNIPMSYLVEGNGGNGQASNLIIDKQGPGRLYYRIGMKYAPRSLKLDPADYGFTVLRKYEAVDDPEDVIHNPDGSWTIRSGARVRVRLTMVAQARRYHVALVDNLPAGLEILNPGLAVTEAVPRDTGGGSTGVIEVGNRSIGRNYYWWRHYWFEHQNFRDERAEAFASLLWEGVYNYTYVTRATTPGEFIVPPAKAEEMYQPETFGRTGTDRVIVE